MAPDRDLDYSLFQSINSHAGRSPALDAVMIAVAKYSPYFLALVLVALWLSWKYRNQRCALLAGISSLIALGLGQIVGHAFPRQRPFLAHKVTVLVPHSLDTSFPSDHTTLAFAIATTVFLFNRRLGAYLLIFGLVIAYSRVFIGAHYPGDVAGGAVLGALTALGIARISRIPRMGASIDWVFLLLARGHLAARQSSRDIMSPPQQDSRGTIS